MSLNNHKKNFMIPVMLVLLICANLLQVPVSAQTPPTVSDFTKTGIKN